jgi:group I intron endonuclease
MLTNKLTKDFNIGQSKELSKIFKQYFYLSYIKRNGNLIISRALIKYGYSKLSVTILEYSAKSDLLNKEQRVDGSWFLAKRAEIR